MKISWLVAQMQNAEDTTNPLRRVRMGRMAWEEFVAIMGLTGFSAPMMRGIPIRLDPELPPWTVDFTTLQLTVPREEEP